MTLIARLPDNEIIMPAVLLATGQKSARELDRELKGGTYYCPLCEGYREQIRLSSFGRLTETLEALEYMDFQVRYRCASYKTLDEVQKSMHFAHSKGISKLIQQLAGIDIHEGYNDNAHDIAVLRFLQLLAEEYPVEQGYKLEKEKLIRLDVPPVKRRPDIAIYKENQDNNDSPKKIDVAVEVQFSFQSFQDFQERNNHLLLLASEVRWYIYKRIYHRMGDHRRWLSDKDIPYFLFWVDEKTGIIQYRPGKPPEGNSAYSRTKKSKHNETEGSCSLANSIGLTREEIEKEIEKRKNQRNIDNIQVATPEYAPEDAPTNSKKVSKSEKTPVVTPYKIGDYVEVETSRGWKPAIVSDSRENGLPIVRLEGKNPIDNYHVLSLEYIRPLKRETSTPTKQVIQGTLF